MNKPKGQTTAGYPEWICGDCGKKYGQRLPKMMTSHKGECEICGFTKEVTEPRDFGHLKDGWHEHIKR